MSYFSEVSLLPDDPIFRLPLLFKQDKRPEKVNLGIGVYLDEKGEPTVFSSVRKAEAILFDQKRDKNYQPIDGDSNYIAETLRLIFGKSSALAENRIFGIQTVGGAGALRLGADFLRTFVNSTIYLSEPTWVNHYNIFKRAGMQTLTYPYYTTSSHGLDFSSLCKTILSLPPKSVMLFQGCGHNPTGLDPTQEQWKELSALIKKQQIFPFFDLAYQGFASHLDDDAFAVRYFASEGHEMLVAYSFSKNMGLYGERVGALAVVSNEKERLPSIASHLRQMVRGLYSTPPLHGGLIAALILQDPALRREWIDELNGMNSRLRLRRQQLAENLQLKAEGSDYRFLNDQKGMFAFCGLAPHQVKELTEKFSIYLPDDGRINIAGLTEKNLDYVSTSILHALHS